MQIAIERQKQKRNKGVELKLIPRLEHSIILSHGARN
jgi:hypothetical protein